jgi:hypothetical protein
MSVNGLPGYRGKRSLALGTAEGSGDMPENQAMQFDMFLEDTDVGESAPIDVDQDDDEVQAILHSRDNADPSDSDGEAS